MELRAEYLMLRRITGLPAARVWRVLRACAARGIIEHAMWYLVYGQTRDD